MPNWTKEQQQAIDARKGNYIISAGAGSGKTAVLTERVYQMIKEGYGLDEFVVLTFTNLAAFEMRERIRKKLLSDEKYREIAGEVDTSYIMTFDAFALSLVKKYHYLLGLDPNIAISDESLVQIQKIKELQVLLDEYYASPSPAFLHYLDAFLLRDDDKLQEFILRIDRMVDLKIDEEAFFDNYFATYFSEEKIKGDIHQLFLMLKKEVEELLDVCNNLTDDLDRNAIIDKLEAIINTNNYQEFYNLISGFAMPRLSSKRKEEMSDDDLLLRASIKKQMDYIKAPTKLGDEQALIEGYLSTKDDVALCLEITKELRRRLKVFKKKQHIYTFMDIAKYALKVIDHPIVQEEFVSKIKAIMVDEYQDTSDIQDYFLSKMARNNLYMVGDIKQSIYRFRNANCQLFLDKYESYASGNGGTKIDLNQNFRSRPEVIVDINHIFSRIMHLDLGGANYLKDHIILASNKAYLEEGRSKENYHLEIKQYSSDEGSEEAEARLIAQDIVEKVHKYPVFDKDKKEFHKAKFRDFVILMDRKTKFDFYKKIFEEYHIPAIIVKNEDLKSSIAVIVLQSLLKVYHAIAIHKLDDDFIHAYASIYRSFINHGSDLELERIIKTKDFVNDSLYQEVEKVVNETKDHSLSTQVRQLLLAFDYEYRLLRIGNVAFNEKKIEQLLTSVEAMEKLGYTLEDFILYLDNINEFNLELTSPFQDDGSDAVRIMSIHASKGLEFPIVYYSGLYARFNDKDTQTLFMASSNHGLIVPHECDSYPDTFYHYLVKRQEKLSELGEKIRLLYVALTRTKEKMIILQPKRPILSLTLRNSKSLNDLLTFGDVIERYGYIAEVDEEVIPLDIITLDEGREEQVVIKDHHIPMKLKTKKSRPSLTPVDVDQEALDFGEELHLLLEMVDLKHPDLSFIEDERKRHLVSQFLENELVKEHINDQIYHEYAYYDSATNTKGIIDLLFINDHEATIVDFKTSIIDADKYHDQLTAYQDYITRVFNLPCRLFLYSIIKAETLEIK